MNKMTGWAQIRLRLLSHRNEDSVGLELIALIDLSLLSLNVRIDIDDQKAPFESLQKCFHSGQAFKIT